MIRRFTAALLVAVLAGACSALGGIAQPSLARRTPEPVVSPTPELPGCTPGELASTASDRGTSLGNGAAIVSVHNGSASACVLSGYPALELLAPSGDAIPTDDVRATDGAYLFPAIPESIVVLEPGEDASFQLAYAANPFGPLATATLDVACPRSTALGVELPDGDGSITVSLELRACNHWLAATPWFPGSTWVGFDAIEP